jgi:multidrug resistance protein, MATE family
MAISSNLGLKVNIGYKDIFKTILPIFIALSIPNISFIANNYFFSQLGQNEMGVGLIAGVYFLLFTAIGYGLNAGLQSIMSRRAGEEDIMGMSKTFFNGLCINVVIGFVGILFTYTIAPLLFDYFLINLPGKSQETSAYLKIRILSLPLLMLIQLLGSLFISVNKAFFIIFITITETIANIFFDYAFIFGNFGFKAMGFNGAAYASIIADVLGIIVGISTVLIFKLNKRFSLFKFMAFNASICKRIFLQSAPLVFQNIISIGSWLFFFFLINDYGKTASAISSIMRNIFAISTTLVWASGSATNSMVSNVMGQNKPHLVWPLIKRMLLICVSWAAILCVLMNIFPHAFIDIFDKDGSLFTETLPVLKVISIVTLFLSVSCILLNASTGTGNPTFNLKVEIFAVICYLTYSYLSAKVYHLSLTYLWLNEFVYWTAILIIIYPFLLSKKWRNTKL